MSLVTSATTDTVSFGSVAVSGAAPEHRFDKIVEIVAVILLGITTIGTAWCGFESVRWSGASSDHAQAASDKHVEAARLFGLATQEIAYDTMITAQYAQAVASGNDKLVQFYRDGLVRKDFLPVLDAWQREVEAGRKPSPLADNQDYLAGQLGGYRTAIAEAEAESQLGRDAGAAASSYVSVTILLAAALFFAGVISSFRYRAARALLLAAALATLAVAASRMASLPVLLW